MGIGVDILKVCEIRKLYSKELDPFFKKSFTEKENKQALEQPDPVFYYATRFAGKEAVFKSISKYQSDFIPSEIEIISLLDGRPEVTLLGTTKEKVEKYPIKNIHISLSFDEMNAIAFAIAE